MMNRLSHSMMNRLMTGHLSCWMNQSMTIRWSWLMNRLSHSMNHCCSTTRLNRWMNRSAIRCCWTSRLRYLMSC